MNVIFKVFDYNSNVSVLQFWRTFNRFSALVSHYQVLDCGNRGKWETTEILASVLTQYFSFPNCSKRVYMNVFLFAVFFTLCFIILPFLFLVTSLGSLACWSFPQEAFSLLRGLDSAFYSWGFLTCWISPPTLSATLLMFRSLRLLATVTRLKEPVRLQWERD